MNITVNKTIVNKIQKLITNPTTSPAQPTYEQRKQQITQQNKHNKIKQTSNKNKQTAEVSRQLTHLMSTVLTAKVRACTTTKPSHSVGLPQEPMTSRDQKTKQGRSEHYNETQSQAQHSTPAEVQHYSASHYEICKVAGCAPPFLGPLCSKLQLFLPCSAQKLPEFCIYVLLLSLLFYYYCITQRLAGQSLACQRLASQNQQCGKQANKTHYPTRLSAWPVGCRICSESKLADCKALLPA